jgi:hypothetical protein
MLVTPAFARDRRRSASIAYFRSGAPEGIRKSDLCGALTPLYLLSNFSHIGRPPGAAFVFRQATLAGDTCIRHGYPRLASLAPKLRAFIDEAKATYARS